MNNKFFITNLIKIVLGISIIIYLVYIRLLLVRAPRDLTLYNPSLNYKLFFLVLIGIFVSLFICYKTIRIIRNLEEKETKIQSYLKKINEIIDSSLKTVLEFLLNYIPNNYEMIFNLAKNFYFLFGKRNEGFFVLISLVIRIIIVFLFLIDIFFFFEFNYFYKSLILLCLPLMINLFFYNLREFADNLEEIKSYLIIIDEGKNSEGKPITTFQLSPGNENLDLTYLISQFIICNKIKGYLDGYYFYYYYYGSRFNLVIYFLYLAGWMTIIVKNFLLLR